jgi:hypothetical protein
MAAPDPVVSRSATLQAMTWARQSTATRNQASTDIDCIGGAPECRTLLSNLAKIDRDPAPRPVMLLPIHCFKEQRPKRTKARKNKGPKEQTHVGKQKAPRKIRGAVGKSADVDGNYLSKAPPHAYGRGPVTKPSCERCQQRVDLLIMPRS